MTLTVAVAVAVVPVPIPVPTLKQPEATVSKGFSIIAWQPHLAPDYRSGLNICFFLATTSGGRWSCHWKPEAPKKTGAS